MKPTRMEKLRPREGKVSTQVQTQAFSFPSSTKERDLDLAGCTFLLRALCPFTLWLPLFHAWRGTNPSRLHRHVAEAPAQWYLVGIDAAVDCPRSLEVLEHALLEWAGQTMYSDEVLEILHAAVVERASGVHALDDGCDIPKHHCVHQRYRGGNPEYQRRSPHILLLVLPESPCLGWGISEVLGEHGRARGFL